MHKVLARGKVPPHMKTHWTRSFTHSASSLDEEHEESDDEPPGEEAEAKPPKASEAREKKPSGWRRLFGRSGGRSRQDNDADVEAPPSYGSEGSGQIGSEGSSRQKPPSKGFKAKIGILPAPSSEEEHASVLEYLRMLFVVGAKMPKKPHSLEGLRALWPCNSVSLVEWKAARLVKHEGLDVVREVHRKAFSRIFPLGSRVDSSNFNPVPFWNAGYQLVALNYQSPDLSNIANHGLFRNENGGAGYILKPPALLASVSAAEEPISPVFSLHARSSPSNHLEVTILSGHNLPMPEDVLSSMKESAHSLHHHASLVVGKASVNPAIRVTLCNGKDKHPHKGVRGQTSFIYDNGFNPSWGSGIKLEVHEADTCILVFEVLHAQVDLGLHKNQDQHIQHDSRVKKAMHWAEAKTAVHSVIAAAAFPLSGLREGLRWVPLNDNQHRMMHLSGLLIKATFVGPWAETRRGSSDAAAAELDHAVATASWTL